MRRKLLLFLLGGLTLGIAGTIPVVPRKAVNRDGGFMGPPEPTRTLQTPDDAVRAALADMLSIPIVFHPYVRYLWVQDASTNSMKTTSLALNYISRGSGIQRPAPVANGFLLRIDLRQYAPRDEDIKEWLRFWEELAFDPSFALLITKDTVDKRIELERAVSRVVLKKVVEYGQVRHDTVLVDHPGGVYRYPDDSGRYHNDLPAGRYSVDLEFRGSPIEKEVQETVTTKEAASLPKGVDVLRFNGPHIDPLPFRELQSLTHSLAPVVDHRYFKQRALTTIKDKGVFKTVFGGLYYEFRGVRKAKDALGQETKATDLDLFFEDLGIGNIRGGLDAESLFNKLRSDQRVAVFRSLVTGKPREVDSFHTPAEKEGGSWGAITGDVKDGEIDIGDNPVANLLRPRRSAREAIFPTRTGFPIFALFNGEGARQDEVPPDIAADSTIPAPYTRRLQSAISCIRCHGIDGSDGWKPLVNDVKKLLDGRSLDVFGDLSARGKAFETDTNDRLVGLFNGDFSKNLRRARDDLAEATLKATGPWEGGSGDQTDAAKIAATHLADEFADYNYTLVDAHVALWEMGVDCKHEEAVKTFRAMVPPDMRQADKGPSAGLILEDPRIAALRAGLSIGRADWSLSHSYAAERARESLKRAKK